MKYTLMSGSYLDGIDFFGGSRLERTMKWLDYQYKNKDSLGFDRIVLVDNASDKKKTSLLQLLYRDLDIFRFEENLSGKHTNFDYPYAWRMYEYIFQFARRGEKKIVMMESDFYVLSTRFADHIRNLASGWETVYTSYFDFPECGFQIMCPDSIDKAIDFMGDWKQHLGKHMEKTLPFTKINSLFVGDRYGEIKPVKKQSKEMDYYAQCPNEIEVTFGLY